MGSRALVVKDETVGPIENRVRFMTVEAFQHWLRNRPTEILGSDGKIKTITWASAWMISDCLVP